MSRDRHIWVAFYPSAWMTGTAGLPRIHRSVYFDLCCRMWETGNPIKATEARMMVADLPNGVEVIDDLVEMGKLIRHAGGVLSNERALEEAGKSIAKVDHLRRAGKASAAARAERKMAENSESEERGSNDGSTHVEHMSGEFRRELESESESKGSDAYASGAVAPGLGLNGGSFALPNPDEYPDKVDWLFHPAVIGFMCSGGANEKNVRAFIGKLRAVLGPPLAVKRILEARDGKVSDPISYLQSRLPKRREATGVHRRHFDDVDYGESGKL